PWRCLWRGFLQMMRTTPSRRTILQCSHRTLTDGLTFISCPFEPCHRSPQAARVPSALGRPSARNAFRVVSPLVSRRPCAFGTWPPLTSHCISSRFTARLATPMCLRHLAASHHALHYLNLYVIRPRVRS